MHDHAADRRAALAAHGKGGAIDLVQREIEIACVVQDRRVLTAQFETDFGKAGGSCLRDDPADADGAGEADRIHALGGCQHGAEATGAVGDLEDPLGQRGVCGLLHDERRAGRAYRRLEDHGIAIKERRDGLANGRAEREVPRVDPDDDTARPSCRINQCTGSLRGKNLAYRRRGSPCGRTPLPQRLGHLAARLRNDLAHFAGDRTRDVLATLFELVEERIDHPPAFGLGHLGPGKLCRLRCPDHGGHILGARGRVSADDLAWVCRVADFNGHGLPSCQVVCAAPGQASGHRARLAFMRVGAPVRPISARTG